MNDVKCPKCSKEYENIAFHWSQKSSHRPGFTSFQREVICGLIMGDGYVSTQSKNPYLDVSMTNKKYLQYLDSIFGIFSLGVNKHRDSSDFNDEYNHKDVYRFRSRTHPEIKIFEDWYSTGEKIFPEDIPLSPTVLRHWYVGDGNLYDNRDIRICSTNEIKNKKKLTNMFERHGLPEPDYWYEKEGTNYMAWRKDNSKFLFEYMQMGVPGFDYKFEVN